MFKKSKTRNPIAKNAWKSNTPKAIPPKKGKGSPYKRVKKVHINI